MATNSATPWQIAAEPILATALKSAEGFRSLRYTLSVTEAHLPPGPWRATWNAVDMLRQLDKEVALTTVYDKCSSEVALEWIGERWLVPSLSDDLMPDQVDILKGHAQAARQLALLDQARGMLTGATEKEQRIKVIGDLISALEAHMDTVFTDPTATGAGERFAALMSDAPKAAHQAGIAWVDQLTGGLHPEQIWWVAGAYKMRKSSLMRNIALNLAQAGGSVTVCTLEGSQSMVIAQFVAMLAARWMLKEGIFSQNDGKGRPLNGIGSQLLLTLRGKYTTVLDKRQVAAVDAGIAAYRALGDRLRVYDSTRANGGVSDLASVQTIARRDKHLYGCDLMAVDYLQRLKGQGQTYFDVTAQNALGLQALALGQGFTLLVLAQRNEETVKLRRDDGYSPGVKGGGDPAATADYLFVTQYPFKYGDGSETRDRLGIECRLARHGEAGGSVDVAIHAASGLIIPDATLAAPVDFGPMDTVYRGGQ